MDVQGPTVVRPYTDKYKVTFPVAVDMADVFGQAFGLKAIPVSFLVDEVGLVRLHGGGPTGALLNEIETILREPMLAVRGASPKLAAALSQDELAAKVGKDPNDWKSRLALAQILDDRGQYDEAVAQLTKAFSASDQPATVLMTWGLVLLHQNDKPAALRKLKQARDLDPDNWRIRKQIWALENPDKFYEDHSPDYGWQKEELAREKQEHAN